MTSFSLHIKDSEGGPNAEMFCSLRINLHNLSIFVTFHYILYKSIIQVYICCVIITCLSSFPETISLILLIKLSFQNFQYLDFIWIILGLVSEDFVCVCDCIFSVNCLFLYVCLGISKAQNVFFACFIIIYVSALYISPLNK